MFDEIAAFDHFSCCFGIFGVLQCFKKEYLKLKYEYILIKRETQILEALISDILSLTAQKLEKQAVRREDWL